MDQNRVANAIVQALDQSIRPLVTPLPQPSMQRHSSGIYIPADTQPTGPLKALDLFAGAGGFSLGAHDAGVHVVGAVEWEIPAALTYIRNLAERDVNIYYPRSRAHKIEPHLSKLRQNPDAFRTPGCQHFWLSDIRKISSDEIMNKLRIEPGELDIIIGDPPCQGFSQVGQRNIMDPRNSLVFEFARVIRDLQPKGFIMENVPGISSMVTAEKVPVLDAFVESLAIDTYQAREAIKESLATQAGYFSAGRSTKPPSINAGQQSLGLL